MKNETYAEKREGYIFSGSTALGYASDVISYSDIKNEIINGMEYITYKVWIQRII